MSILVSIAEQYPGLASQQAVWLSYPSVGKDGTPAVLARILHEGREGFISFSFAARGSVFGGQHG